MAAPGYPTFFIDSLINLNLHWDQVFTIFAPMEKIRKPVRYFFIILFYIMIVAGGAFKGVCQNLIFISDNCADFSNHFDHTPIACFVDYDGVNEKISGTVFYWDGVKFFPNNVSFYKYNLTARILHPPKIS